MTFLFQVDPGGEGEHRAEGGGDREPGQQCGDGRPLPPPQLPWQPGLHDPLPHLLHPRLPLAPKLWTLHPTPAPLPRQGQRQTGTTSPSSSLGLFPSSSSPRPVPSLHTSSTLLLLLLHPLPLLLHNPSVMYEWMN